MPSSITFILGITRNDYKTIVRTINNTNLAGDKIISCFTLPRLALKDTIQTAEAQHADGVIILSRDENQPVVTKTLNARPSTIDGYSPRNKKLLQYPFLYLAFNPSNRITKYISL